MENQSFGGRKRELQYLIGAMRESLTAGGEYLASRRYPTGPICSVRNLNYIHKAVWGMYVGGVDHGIIASVLDWVEKESLQPNGDFYFPEEPAAYKNDQRAYRALTFMKVAVWLGHPLAKNEKVLQRLFQYQHSSGGVFPYIGDSPAKVGPRQTLSTLNTSFFGHLMIYLGEKEKAVHTGDFLANWVDQNKAYMPQGFIYTQMTLDGKLITEVLPEERYLKMVDARYDKQEFWHTGTTQAFLADLYEALRDKWGYNHAQASRYLDAALALLPFDAPMPLDGYLWPSKCKVGWGTGELLRVLCKYGLGNAQQIEDSYQVGRKVAVHTFMNNQLPNGGWSAMHYPLSMNDPEYQLSYVPIRGRVNVPQDELPGISRLFLPAEELSGEFLGELASVFYGCQQYLASLA